MSAAQRVGLLFGGSSVEHEVSVDSARSVAAAMQLGSLTCVPLAVTGAGRWLTPRRSREILDGDARRVEPQPRDVSGRLAVEPGGGLVLLADGHPPEALALDVVFPLIHGWGGEDGRLQGLLDLAGLACVGAGVLGSALAMDKRISKILFQARSLPVAPWFAVSRAERDRDPGAAERAAAEIGFPLFVKPANGGSSVGISKVARAEALDEAFELALAHDRTAVVERGIDAREIECAVLGNDEPRASCLGEIFPSQEFYDYEAKYVDGTSRIQIPAELDAGVTEIIRSQALEAFRALDLGGFARVDFFVEKGTGRILLNEVNSLPGFTSISMFPKLWEASGLAYPALVERLVELALERVHADRRRATRSR